MAEPIVNPQIPYIGDVPQGLQPGRMIRIQGVTHPDSERFNVNLATGPNTKPRDDTALHVSARIQQGYVARNSYKNGGWGDEQGQGKLPIGNAQSFEMIILVDPNHYKIAINGQHFCEFPHRIPFQEVTHILIDGDVSITLISFEGIAIPGGITATQASPVHAEGPQGGPPQFGGPPQYGPPPGGYGPPPPNYGGYGPPPPPGAEPQSEMGGFFEKAQDILAGAIKSGAAEKLLGSIMHSGGGQQQQQQQGYAPQNARYGIYPDLPTQDAAALPPQNTGKFGEQDSALSGLIAGSGGTITSGPQPGPQSGAPFGGQNIPINQSAAGGQQPGPLEGLLSGILGGKGGQTGGNQQTGGAGESQQTQPAGADLLSTLLSSLLSGSKQDDQPGAQNPSQYGGAYPPGSNQPPNAQGGTPDVLSGILQSLLSGSKDQQAPGGQNQPPYGPQSPPNTQGGQGQSSDALSGILSNLLSSSQSQQNPAAPNQPPQGQNQGGGDILSSILQNLVSGGNQQTPAGQNVPPQHYNQPPPNYNQPPPNYNQPQNPPGQGGQNNPELLTNLLQGLLSKAGEQHDNTRPIQETNPSGGGPQSPGPAQNPQQQYGQYPHPPQQEQKGPMESLLSGLLSGGGGQQHHQQQPHVPQVGGEGSVGGLGSMGGILGSLAGSLLHRPAFKTTPSDSLYPKLPSAPCYPASLSYPTPRPIIGLIAPEPGLLPNSGMPQPSQGTQQSFENPPPYSAVGNYPANAYPVQYPTGPARNMYPIQPVGFSGYPFPAVQTSSYGYIKKPKKSKPKKAIKYGLPIAGAGLATYTVSRASTKATKALKKGFSCSSSSSSSSSDSD